MGSHIPAPNTLHFNSELHPISAHIQDAPISPGFFLPPSQPDTTPSSRPFPTHGFTPCPNDLIDTYEDLGGAWGEQRRLPSALSDVSTSASEKESCIKVKLMCSFGGKILPRPSDGNLRYVGGETRIVSVSRDILYADLVRKMTELYGQHLVALKYQLPGEDLDALVSIMSDEDVENMMEEYDKLDASEGSPRLRVFLILNGVEMEGGGGGLLDFPDSCAKPLFLPDLNAWRKMGQVEKRIIDPPLEAQVDSHQIFAERVPQVQPGIGFDEVLPHQHQGTRWESLTSPNQGIPPRATHIENFPQELMDSDAPNECGRVYQTQKGHHYDDTLRGNPGHMPFYNAQESHGQFLGEAFERSTTNMNAYNNGHPRVGTLNYKEEACENKLGFNGVSLEDCMAADLLSAHFTKALDMPLNPSCIDEVSLDAHLTTHPTIFMGEAMPPLEEGICTPQITQGRPIFPVIDSLLLQDDQGNVVTQKINQEEIEGKKADSGTSTTTYQPTLFSLPTLSIQNWVDCLAQTELEEQAAMNDLQNDKNSKEVNLEEVSSEKKGGEAAFEELRIGGDVTETDNARQTNPDDAAAAAESEAIARGLQIIPNSDLEELRELGSGNFGTVYHGKWRGTDVAIKRIKSSCFSGRSAERDRLVVDFWQEACILSQLHHPNVLAFYGVAPDGPDGTLATITEYMVNGSLKQALQKDRGIDQRKRLLIAMDVAFGMEYLHGKNIIHFDLKCDNLLVNMRDPQRPICKVGDLGLSKVKHQTMVSGGVRGTLPWMAPELLNGSSGLVSEKVDVFSFGIVMWELLTGEEPYANMHYGAIIGGIVSNTLRPPIPSACEPAWRSLMEFCWSADPSERPPFSEIAKKLRSMAASSLQAS